MRVLDYNSREVLATIEAPTRKQVLKALTVLSNERGYLVHSVRGAFCLVFRKGV